MSELLSGGPINLTTGWALIPFVGTKAYYWTELKAENFAAIHKGEKVRFWESLCKVEAQTYAGVPPLRAGNFPKCKRCQKTLGEI